MTNKPENHDLAQILIEILDNQKIQIERQAEALALQKEQFELVKTQFEQARKIQDKAELLQEGSRKFVLVVLSIITVLLIMTALLNFFG